MLYLIVLNITLISSVKIHVVFAAHRRSQISHCFIRVNVLVQSVIFIKIGARLISMSHECH